jgi:hypothetical protein
MNEFEISTRQCIDGTTHDISSTGFGMIVRQSLPVGDVLDITLTEINSERSSFARGQVIWSHQVGQNLYRIGVKLQEKTLQPIPLVLRFLLMKARHRQTPQ